MGPFTQAVTNQVPLLSPTVKKTHFLLVIELAVGAAVLLELLDDGVDGCVLVRRVLRYLVYGLTQYGRPVNEVDALLVAKAHLHSLFVASYDSQFLLICW